MFPILWSNEKIMNAVSEVSVNNPWVQQTGSPGKFFTKSGNPSKFTVQGKAHGLPIKVVVTGNDVITAHPSPLPWYRFLY